MKTHRSDFKSGFPAQQNSNIAADLDSCVSFRCREPRQQFGSPVFRVTAGLIVAMVLILILWVALTKPAGTTPSPSWRTALSLAERGAEEAIAELRRMDLDARKSGGAGNASGRHPVLRWDRTLIHSNLRLPGEAMGSWHVTVSEDGPACLAIRSTGIVYDEYRTLAQRTLHTTARRPPLFQSAVFARRGLFVAEGAEVKSYGSGSEGTETTLSSASMKEDRSGEEPLPVLLPPWGLPRRGAVMLAGGDVLTLSDSGVFPTVTLLGSSRLIIDNDVVLHIAGRLLLRGESRIVTRRGVRAVSMYINEDVIVEEDAAIVNLSQSALSLSIVGMARYSSITLGMREPFYGTVYAPNSAIRVGPGSYLCGGVCGDTVHVLAGSRVDYDRRLASLPSSSRPFEVVSCRER